MHEYGLTDHFKLNIEPNHTTLAGHAPEHDIAVASAFGQLGSIDANTGDPLVGYDTDQFPMNLQDTTAIRSIVIQQPGGLNRGGLNFDAKVRRESIAPRDLVLAHVWVPWTATHSDCAKRWRCTKSGHVAASACSTNGTCRGVSPQ